MAILLKRQLSDAEKLEILAQHGRKCFANGHSIPEGEPVHFDHIRAYSSSGQSELNNVAPMCQKHNLEKGVLPLADFRVKLRLQEFFAKGDKLTLKDLLEYLAESKDIATFAQPVSFQQADGLAILESAQGQSSFPLNTCPTTGWKYFYANLDVSLIDSDDDQDHEQGLQPRYLIFDKVFDLYRHFQVHPVLQPSVGRIVANRIRLFDGQHKIAALLWEGRRQFECKVYISPDLRLLNQTNIAAHDKFAQTRFFSSIMVLKLGSQFGADFEHYKNLEDGQAKTEAGFFSYLSRLDSASQTKAEVANRFRSYLYYSILESDENRLKALVSASNRRSDDKPLTMDMLQKSIFKCFLYKTPTTDNMATESFKRDAELRNTVSLLNMLFDLGLCAWNPKASPNDSAQRKLNRFTRSKSMMAWAELLRDAVCGKLEIFDAEEKERMFYRDLSDPDLERTKSVVERLINWKRWDGPEGDEIDRVLADNKTEVKEWFRNHGLTTGYLMGASE